MTTVPEIAAKNFFDEWSIYNEILDRDYMLHDEIYLDVQRFFADRYGNRPFSLLDLGCGSARHLAAALTGRLISGYVGYDLSEEALKHAARNLEPLGCLVELHAGDLLGGLTSRRENFDVIFTSFALHHLSVADKSIFFHAARERLTKDGILLLIDTMRDDGEDRSVYLDRYCAWLRSRCETLSAEALDLICVHIRNCDFPETTADLDTMATLAGFRQGVEVKCFGWHRAWYFDLGGHNRC